MDSQDDAGVITLLEATRWESTPLGPRAFWSPALKASWSICARSRFPMILFWGDEHVQLYNAAYAPLAGARHPQAFGRRAADCPIESWDRLEPLLRLVLDARGSGHGDESALPLRHGAGPNGAAYTFSYGPVFGADERPEGVFCTVTETVSGARRPVFGEAADADAETRELRLIASAVERFSDATMPSTVLEALADMIVPELADWCIIQLREEDKLETVAIAHRQRAKRDLAWLLESRYGYRIGDGSPTATVAETGTTQLLADLAPASLGLPMRDDEHFAVNEALQLRSALIVPIRTDAGVVGVVRAVQAESGRRFEEHDARTLERLVDRAAAAYQAATSAERERSVASTLQRALLPGTLPILEGLLFSVSYTPAAVDAKIGGDWYDAFPLADGRIVVSIGDVVGHGLDAAVSMATLRHAIRGYAVEESRPGAILSHINRVLIAEQRGDLATALVATVDPRTLEVVFASAGHYGPLVGAPGKEPVEHAPVVGCLLGVDPDATYAERRFGLRSRETMVLYTDGLVEAQRDVVAGEARLREIFPSATLADDIATAIYAGVLEGTTPQDDVAVFAVTATATLERLDFTTTSAPANAARIRVALRRFLAGSTLPPDRAEEIVIAAGEAVSNALEHAYHANDGQIRVTGRKTHGEVLLEVRDFGRWQDRESAEGRGFGLTLMRELADGVAIEATPHGTRIQIRARLAAARPVGARS